MVNAGHKVVFLPVESSVQTSAGARYPLVNNNGLYMLTESTEPEIEPRHGFYSPGPSFLTSNPPIDTRYSASLAPRHGPSCPPTAFTFSLQPPTRSHVRTPWSGRLLRGRCLIPPWFQKASSHYQLRIHASFFLNHWSSGRVGMGPNRLFCCGSSHGVA